MKIAIIGAGNVGSTLGNAWANKGHDICFGVRHPQDDKTRQLVQSIGGKAQAALFGVYGMLGIGLMLMCLRALLPSLVWKEGMLKFAFWAMNVGLMAMVVISLLPVGLMQTWASVDKGYWYARSPEFLHTEVMQTLRWLRVPGDTIFALGAIALVLFVAGLKTGYSIRGGEAQASPVKEPEAVA